MTEIKKTYNNPPSGLIKAVLKNQYFGKFLPKD